MSTGAIEEVQDVLRGDAPEKPYKNMIAEYKLGNLNVKDKKQGKFTTKK